MRILYIFNSLGVGGTERLVLDLAARMQARGHNVVLMVLLPPSASDMVTDLELIHLGLRPSPSSLVGGFRRASAFFRSYHPDVVHSHNFHGNIFARLLCGVHRHPKLVCTIHNIHEGGWLRMLAYRVTDHLADVTTAVSEAVAARYTQKHAVSSDQCVVLTNGIDTRRFTPDEQRRHQMREHMGAHHQFIWMAVARNARSKDLPNLLKAFDEVTLAFPQARLWIAGPVVPSSERKPTTAYRVNQAHGIQHLGVRQDIPELLDAADGFVLSSAWEGMPLALAEAMAMQKPCVATDVGGVGELVGETAILVQPGNAAALASAMLALMKTPPSEREVQGQAARARVCSLYDIGLKAVEWETLYQRLLS